MSDKKRILIIGAGKRGTAVLEMLREDGGLAIAGVVDTVADAPGIKLAKSLGIQTSSDYHELITSDVDVVLNLTGESGLQKELREFTQGKNIELMGDFTSRLIGDLLNERRVQTEIHRISEKMSTSIALEEILVLIMNACIKSTQADGGTLVIVDGDTSKVSVKTSWGIEEETSEMVKKIVRRKLPIWEGTDEVHPLVTPEEWEKEFPAFMKLDQVPEMKTAICAPLRSRRRTIGVLTIHSMNVEKDFSTNQKRLLTMFANQAAVAIENALLYKQAEHLSVTDGLTNLYNHRFFKEQLQKELVRAQRYDLMFSLLVIDLDNFKQYNDKYGHPQGDELLVKATGLLQRTFRVSDFLARYGGDEFVAILPETNKDGGFQAAERTRTVFEREKLGTDKIHITVSIGVASYPEDSIDKDELIKRADKALYEAKQKGKNKTVLAQWEKVE